MLLLMHLLHSVLGRFYQVAVAGIIASSHGLACFVHQLFVDAVNAQTVDDLTCRGFLLRDLVGMCCRWPVLLAMINISCLGRVKRV